MEWICTDPSCNQYRLDVDGEDGSIFVFKEDRPINPESQVTETFTKEINLDDYDWWEKVNACEAFGYTAEQVDKWISEGEELALIAECIFELSN